MEQDDPIEAAAAAEPEAAADPLAAERAALEAERAEAAREREALRRAQDEVRAHGRFGALDAQVAAFEAYDWDQRTAADPRQAQADWMAYLRARDERDRMVEAAGREHAERLRQAHAEVAREIQDWSPETARRLTEFGRSMGFSDAELHAVTDPRQIKVLHAAWQGVGRAQQRAAAEQMAAAQRYAPVPTVSGGGGRIETAADTDDFLAFERLAASRGR